LRSVTYAIIISLVFGKRRSPIMPRRPVLAALLTSFVALSAAAPTLAADDEYRLVIEDHKFQPTEIAVPAGKKVKLVIENRDTTPEEFDSHALNREKVIAGKSTATIYIGPLKPGRYPFIGEYHEESAKGVVVAQ
jgi:plastocyanin